MSHISLHSLVGDLTLFEVEGSLVAVEWGWGSEQKPSEFLINVKKQLQEYFLGKRKTLTIKTTSFENPLEQKIYNIMKKIPFGKTMTYGEIAKLASTGPRVVGRICGQNPIPIVIPCHRVMGVNGKLTGYSGEGGIETKINLLTLEGALPPKLPF